MGSWFSKLKELFSSRKLELCLVGLENSGKTTLLSVLSMGHAVETLPTVGLNVKYVNKDGVNMKVWDLGGQERFRTEWPKYTENCDVILFVVDGHDHKKMPTAKKELHGLLEDKQLSHKPLLVVLNKIDLEPRYTKQEIVKALNLDYLTQPWVVAPISAKYRTNIDEVIEWLLNHSQ